VKQALTIFCLYQLWDVLSDQEAVDLLKNSGIRDPQEASQKLVEQALA
jgi:serine/threonine protein phosphatase PrpC